jgi:hypothetical protein
MGWWFLLGADLLLTVYAVWLLLTAYRVVGKPAGADEEYDAWHRQRADTYKLLGWGWVVFMWLTWVVFLLW